MSTPPTPLERIAAALEKIAERLEEIDPDQAEAAADLFSLGPILPKRRPHADGQGR